MRQSSRLIHPRHAPESSGENVELIVNARIMNSKSMSFFSGAGAAALFLLAACQQSEIPVQPKSQDGEVQTPAAVPVGGESRMITDAGRKATDAEVARFLASREEAPVVEMPEGSAPLAKSAALATCIVDFNNANSLSFIPNQANQTTVNSPYYMHSCNGSHWAYSSPINANSFRLIPENPQWCSGPVPYIGYKSGAYCINHTEGKFWPRKAANTGTNTGVQFFVKSNANVKKNFELQAIYINLGIAEIVAYRPGIGWWVWYPLNAGSRWYWPAGTTVTEIQVYSHGKNGTINFDNLEIAVIP
jgi:hypothetical protein